MRTRLSKPADWAPQVGVIVSILVMAAIVAIDGPQASRQAVSVASAVTHTNEETPASELQRAMPKPPPPHLR